MIPIGYICIVPDRVHISSSQSGLISKRSCHRVILRWYPIGYTKHTPNRVNKLSTRSGTLFVYPIGYTICVPNQVHYLCTQSGTQFRDLLTQAFQTLQDILPDYSWFKRNKSGSMVYNNNNRIPVQSTSLSRRKNKNRGKGVSTYGRRVKDTTLNVTESDSVYVPAPSKRQRSNRLAHDLQQAVLENRPNAKKH